MKEGLRAAALLGRPILLRGIELGRPVDVVLDLEAMRVVGLDVACRDKSRRFLPLPAARLSADSIEVASPLLLLEQSDVSFYQQRSRPLSALLGLVVARGSRPVGTLVDVVLGDEGAISAFVVENGQGGAASIAVDGRVKLLER